MKEFIEKLIERLEKEKSLVPYNRLLDTIEDKPKEVGQLMTYQRVINIVNELAEEYKNTDNITDFLQYARDNADNYDTNEGWSLADLIDLSIKYSEEYINTSTDTSSGWIPFAQRELDEEEKEHYGNEIKYMLDCKLPEEDEEILVTYKWKDEFYVGNDTFLRYGSECYLDSGRDFITEAIAWQPLPAPYKE